MSEHMRKHHTSTSRSNPHLHFLLDENGHVFKIPEKVFKSYINKYEVKNEAYASKLKNKINWEDSLTPGEVFADINAQYTKLGALVKGIRYRENLNQKDFAKKIGITQSDLSKIENGKRPVGQIIASRIIKRFKLSPRIFDDARKGAKRA